MEQTKSDKKEKNNAPVKNKEKKEGFFKRTGRKFKEFWSELKKITWPDAKTVGKNTLIVLVVVLIFFLVIWGFDSLLAYLLGLLVSA
ncbi:MAG: preprotein translocase subunit SecE [Clostridia bacterium]|mgnify:CR=1 FL=1|nr:preprotein translocase subunit SecE [Clostridia bacterium]MDY5263627.1 preprotein translocase subunit SecE [Eubacteriales bacterium]